MAPGEKEGARGRRRRGLLRKAVDFLTFPVRAFTLFHDDFLFLSSLAAERFDYVAGEVRGRCLDVGCGRHNRFIAEHLGGEGVGVDVYKYKGLRDAQILRNPARFSFRSGAFGTVTFIANINHVPERLRDAELSEAYRCLAPGGRIVVTMGSPLAEIIVHKVVYLYDRILGTDHDVDTERGMEEEEAYYLTDSEIVSRLRKAGFANIRKKMFFTQWCLNHMFVGEKGS